MVDLSALDTLDNAEKQDRGARACSARVSVKMMTSLALSGRRAKGRGDVQSFWFLTLLLLFVSRRKSEEQQLRPKVHPKSGESHMQKIKIGSWDAGWSGGGKNLVTVDTVSFSPRAKPRAPAVRVTPRG